MKIYVAVPRDRFLEPISAMVASVLETMGHQPRVIQQYEPSIVQADLLMFLGNGRWMEQKGGIDLRKFERRPNTILWQIETLLPPGTTADAMKHAAKLSRCEWDTFLGGRLRPYRRFLSMHLIRQWYAHGLKREIERAGIARARELNVSSLQFASAQWEWFRRRYHEGLIDYVFTSTRSRAEFLCEQNIPADFVPLGYHPSWGVDLGLERDIDVVFLGQIRRTRRASVLRSVDRQLEKRGIELKVVDRKCWGEERTRLLNRAKIMLDVIRYPWDFMGSRLIMSGACGAIVVSNSHGDCAPYQPEKHFVRSSTEALADTVAEYVENATARKEIADNLRTFLHREITLENALSKIIARSTTAS